MFFVKDDSFLQKIKTKKINRIRQSQFNKYINIFNNIFQTHSLRNTCKDMNISLGGASRAIDILEETLGVQLFIRSGRNGLIPTQDAIKLNELTDRMLDWLDNIATSFTNTKNTTQNKNQNLTLNQQNNIFTKTNHITQNNQTTIRIAYHPLAFASYILPAIKEINQNYDNCIKFSFSMLDREDAINAILSDEVDIIMYPLEGRDIGFLNNFCKCERIGEYDLCLFFNKDHEYAKMKEEYFDWDDIRKINIEPKNKKFKFKTYEEIINQQYNFNNIITTDLLSLYYGIKYNMWVFGAGIEFAEQFNCSNFIIKHIKKMKIFNTIQHWYIIHKNENNIYKQFINYISTSFSTKH